MQGIFILLGTNLGDRINNLRIAKELLKRNKISIKQESAIYSSAAWGKEDQQDFLNQVLRIETSYDPDKLLKTLLFIEEKMGRVRIEKWAERLIDIDILFYNDVIMDDQNLTIPHPHIQERRFTLVPLNEIAAEEVHPKLKKDITTLLTDCIDSLDVKPL